MDVSRTIYLLLTLLALAFPVRRFLGWFDTHGFDLSALWTELSISDPVKGVTFALVLASLATLVFIVGEATTRRDWFSLICVPVTLIFGVAVGLPLYLYLRLRPLRQR